MRLLHRQLMRRNRMKTKKKEMRRLMRMIVDHLDRRRVPHREAEGDTVVENDIDVVIVVDIHHHQVPVRLIQVPRLIVLVRHQVVHIENVDADDLVSCFFKFFSHHSTIVV